MAATSRLLWCNFWSFWRFDTWSSSNGDSSENNTRHYCRIVQLLHAFANSSHALQDIGQFRLAAQFRLLKMQALRRVLVYGCLGCRVTFGSQFPRQFLNTLLPFQGRLRQNDYRHPAQRRLASATSSASEGSTRAVTGQPYINASHRNRNMCGNVCLLHSCLHHSDRAVTRWRRVFFCRSRHHLRVRVARAGKWPVATLDDKVQATGMGHVPNRHLWIVWGAVSVKFRRFRRRMLALKTHKQGANIFRRPCVWILLS